VHYALGSRRPTEPYSRNGSAPPARRAGLRGHRWFGRHKTGHLGCLVVSRHAWSPSQSDLELQATSLASYSRLRGLFLDVVGRWQAAGTFDATADPDGTAQLLTSITLGFVAQRALAGSADVTAHVAALEILTNQSAPDPTVRGPARKGRDVQPAEFAGSVRSPTALVQRRRSRGSGNAQEPFGETDQAGALVQTTRRTCTEQGATEVSGEKT
jgi:hypothetical protein